MANEEHQVLSLIRGKRTTIYHTIALGKFAIDPPKRIITVATSGAWSGMSVPAGFGSATPPTFETFQPVTEVKWNETTGEVIVVVGANQKYDNKSAINLVTGFNQQMILIWNPATNQYESNDPAWIAQVKNQVAQGGADVEYRVNEARDCVLSVGGKKHQSWNLNGAWLMKCKMFMDDPLTIGP